MALKHDYELLSYQDYVGGVAQHVAVDTSAAAASIARLASDPVLRRRMGDAGRQTVSARFDWPVVARLHHELFSELAELRRGVHAATGLENQHPLRADPFRDFASFATSTLCPDTVFRLALPLNELVDRINNLYCFGSYLPTSSFRACRFVSSLG